MALPLTLGLFLPTTLPLDHLTMVALGGTSVEGLPRSDNLYPSSFAILGCLSYSRSASQVSPATICIHQVVARPYIRVTIHNVYNRGCPGVK
ncbi:hypothetical protein GGR51DRAFT_506374 [Nemania sp. FL0031]|nr:hypothetical protein GGR51DRAFT_506374 [Nemania sp. FL0031]